MAWSVRPVTAPLAARDRRAPEPCVNSARRPFLLGVAQMADFHANSGFYPAAPVEASYHSIAFLAASSRACPPSATRPCRLRSDLPGSREPLGTSRGGWDEAVAEGVGGRSGPGLDPDLGEDVAEVARHRLAADHQGGRDLRIGGPSGQELEHLDLPSRERPRG